MWSALYAWDQAFEALYDHFSWLVSKSSTVTGNFDLILVCFCLRRPQEAHGINTNDVVITYELHVMRAHLLHYISLLKDFSTSVEFVRKTANPAMDADDIDPEIRASDKTLLDRECNNLLSEVARLEQSRATLDFRVQNVQRLVSTNIGASVFAWLMSKVQIYTSVNIEDSKAIKRLSYMSMVFLPASFVAVSQHS